MNYDALVIGGGIGGLISASRLAQEGMSVLLVEKLSFLGGRFTAFPNQGVEISSGAFHTFPHGNSGPFAQVLRQLGGQIEVPKADVFASFFLDGKHIVARTGFGAFAAVPRLKDQLMLWRTLLRMWIQTNDQNASKTGSGSIRSFGNWLENLGASDQVLRIYDRFCHFALSVDIYSLPYTEARAITEMILRFGLPGVPRGGAREVIRQLQKTTLAAGVKVLKATTVERLLLDEVGEKITGAVLRDRRNDQVIEVGVRLMISTIGPGRSIELLREAGLAVNASKLNHHEADLAAISPATGLKIHVLSPRSLIPHQSIMLCLDTRRVAGILQATNVDPSLAPAGKHLLISHQIIHPGDDWQTEKELGLADWRYVFGDDFEDCEVIGISQFPAVFPVNWAAQGKDIRTQPYAKQGFWFAGDGAKPEGLMMVEGVAASAWRAANQILGKPETSIPNQAFWLPRYRL